MRSLLHSNARIVSLTMLMSLAMFFSVLKAETPGPVSWQDVASWKHIPGRVPTLSADGQWFAYWYSPNDGPSELILQSTTDETRKTWDIGQTPSSGAPGAIRFSADSRFLAFTVFPEKEKQENDKATNKLTLVDLQNDQESSFENVKGFTFAEENPLWLAVHLNTPKSKEDKQAGKGSNLLLVELQTGNQLSFGNVSDFSFNKKGHWLAMVIDAYAQAGNGLQLRNMNTGALLSPENDQAEYSRLSWTQEGDGLTLLKGTKSEDFEEDVYSVIALKGFEKGSPKKVVFNPHEVADFPEDMTISPNYSPRWSDNLNTLFFGIHRNEIKEKEEVADSLQQVENFFFQANGNSPDKKKEEKTDVIIWHWQDSRLQSVQRTRETQDKNFSYLSLYHVEEDQFIRLADDNLRTINIAPKQKYGIGMDNNSYELLAGMSGKQYADIYTVDLLTGQRELILERFQTLGRPIASPDGLKFAFYNQAHYYSCDMTTGQITPLTTEIPSSFVDQTSDHNIELPPTPFIGWSSDSKEVLIRDNWNIWKISQDGKRYTNLTIDGTENGKQYQGRYTLEEDEQGIDMRQPLFLRVMDQNTKETGIARIDRGRPGTTLLMQDAAVFGNLRKAKDQDIYLFTRETVTEAPDYYMANNAELKNPKKITNIYPDQENFLLSPGSQLITYVSDRGDTLQAALFLPAGYEEGKQYPTVVYIYERLTQGLNSYARPSFPGGGFNRAMYTSNGYAVLMPDITYTLNDPGMSAVWCVLPAVDAAVATGVVDNDNVAIHGHSWGGYQTSFLITQTDRFKAAVAGAPLTNMISMYSLIYWNSGNSNQSIFESSQGRLAPGYWDNMDAFERNSPVYFAKNVNTPLLLMHNDKDGAVDFTQGIEYYNTLRRQNKPVIMLQYEGENHGLRKQPNQLDYALRMMEFLDFHLKGKEAAEWILKGVPRLQMEEHLDERAKLME